ncbi:MAG: hypothetical protein R3272_03495, partial [Candidatus Promineifilaceae bacterium]|nr:hypothetical protein [Candidatus Promineifilaceae bacterium]
MMVGRLYLLLLSLLLLGACQRATEPVSVATVPPAGEPVTPTLQAQPPATTTAALAPTATPTAVPPTATAVPTVTQTATATLGASATSADLSLTAEDFFIYPVPAVYSGDLVTFRVTAHVPEAVDPSDVVFEIQVGDQMTLPGTLSWRTLAGEPVGELEWVWDTTGVSGHFPVTVTLDPDDQIQAGDENPDNNAVSLTMTVFSASLRPAAEIGTEWVMADTGCCRIYVAEGTAAHRDLELLKEQVESGVREAAEKLGEPPGPRIDFYFIDRVIGQGGYAGSSIVVSYLDRNYAGGGLREVVVHEAVHKLDRQFAPERIDFLAEGLAVWVTGGHYKQEAIDQRVVALREEGLFIPLRQLVNDFYLHQHEIGYLQAAGFINYLVNVYGWERVRPFYAAVERSGVVPPAQELDRELQEHFDRSLAEMEGDWMRYLDAIPTDPVVLNDLLTTLRYYDTMRSYQLQYDLTAHFLNAWLPYPEEMVERGVTADLRRHPEEPINVTIEVMLESVDRALRAGEYAQANIILDSVERVLDGGGQFADPLAVTYYQIVTKLTKIGYEVHDVDLQGTRAVVQTTEGTRLRL